MWSVVFVCLFLQVCAPFDHNLTDFTQRENKTAANDFRADVNDVIEDINELKMTEYGSFLDEMMDWASSAREYVRKDTGMQTVLQSVEDGRKLKYKKAELKFIMKTFVILKVILGLVLPLGIIASKILSWKAVTLSLMAFMLAKILFIKNLLTVSGKNAFAVTPTNFAPPLFIQGGPNDVFWKRQGDAQNVYPWSST